MHGILTCSLGCLESGLGAWSQAWNLESRLGSPDLESPGWRTWSLDLASRPGVYDYILEVLVP